MRREQCQFAEILILMKCELGDEIISEGVEYHRTDTLSFCTLPLSDEVVPTC